MTRVNAGPTRAAGVASGRLLADLTRVCLHVTGPSLPFAGTWVLPDSRVALHPLGLPLLCAEELSIPRPSVDGSLGPGTSLGQDTVGSPSPVGSLPRSGSQD